MRSAVYGERRERVNYWELFGVFDLCALRERVEGFPAPQPAQLARAMGELAHARPLSAGHMLPVANAAVKRAGDDSARALELVTVYYHVVREVAGRNITRDTPGTYEMFSIFQSYATVLLGMDDMVEIMDHLSPGGDIPVELLAAMFL